jgi:hypothetical protein
MAPPHGYRQPSVLNSIWSSPGAYGRITITMEKESLFRRRQQEWGRTCNVKAAQTVAPCSDAATEDACRGLEASRAVSVMKNWKPVSRRVPCKSLNMKAI